MDPKNDCWGKLAFMLVESGDLPGYRRLCAELLEREGPTAEGSHAFFVAAVCLHVPGATPDPARLLPLAEKTRGGLPGDLRGIALYRAGQYPKALEVQNEIVLKEQRGRNPTDCATLALIHYRLHQLDDARKWLKEGRDSLPDIHYQPRHYPPPGNLPWGYVLACQQRLREAEALINSPERLAAEACRKKGQWAEALRHYDCLIAADQPCWPDLVARAHCHAELGRYAEAVPDLARVVAAQPDTPRLWYSLALAQLGAGRDDDYRRTCAAMLNHFAKTANPEAAMRTVFTCVYLPEAVPDYDRLLDLAERAIKAGRPRHLRAAVLFRAGKYAAAVEPWEQSLQDWKGPWPVWNWLFAALTYHHVGQPEQARAYLEKSREWLDNAKRESAKPGAVVWDSPYQPVEFARLLREAETLILSKP